jgi:tyrosyl-tRNA synthetase
MSKVITDEKQIDEILERGVEAVFPTKQDLKKKLMSGERIKLYCGFDPTAESLHIGNAINIRKLAKFQELGHEVIFLIGDFTAMIGDPTDKMAARTALTREQVMANCKDYKKQADRLIDFKGDNAAQLKYNSEWLGKLNFEDVLNLASHFTVQQMVERDMFEKRIEEGKPVYIHEFMYPLMQGYDSVAMDIDLELGGNDQTFNMLAGRTLQKVINNKEKFVLTMKLLVDPTGKKMGKTEGNMINLTDSPENIFGKVMSWSDQMIALGFEICTDVPMKEIEDMTQQMKDGANPRDFKMKLAHEIVSLYKGKEQADQAKENFINVFQKKEGPGEDVKEIKVKSRNIIDILVESGLVDSNSEAKRVIKQGGVKVNDQLVEDIDLQLASGKTHLIQKGKRHFVKVIV